VIARRADMVVTRWGARFMGRRFPVAIGRGGITAEKREGDGATPAGVWHLLHGGYRADRGARPSSGLPLDTIGPRDIWSDDPNDPDYNQWLTGTGHPYSHEALRRADPLYDLVLASDWNYPLATPGRGSAIFVHVWRRPRYPTAGCLAFRRDHLAWILARWTPRSRIIVQL
jgi:L,D-peptidoglycan transpeptidase YkuD (ErfK/YbiS/YcfS/YnhG family)